MIFSRVFVIKPRLLIYASFSCETSAGNWKCSRGATLYDGINCPAGHYKVPRAQFDKQCDLIGSPCPQGYTCYCKPCIKAYEVDVLPYKNVTSNKHHTGCDKMSVCGTVQQTEKIKFRIFDNRQRDGEDVITAVMHVGQDTLTLPVERAADDDYAYDFTFSHDMEGVGILEVYAKGVQIPESPFRVDVIERDCEIEFPGRNKVAVRVRDDFVKR